MLKIYQHVMINYQLVFLTVCTGSVYLCNNQMLIAAGINGFQELVLAYRGLYILFASMLDNQTIGLWDSIMHQSHFGL